MHVCRNRVFFFYFIAHWKRSQRSPNHVTPNPPQLNALGRYFLSNLYISQNSKRIKVSVYCASTRKDTFLSQHLPRLAYHGRNLSPKFNIWLRMGSFKIISAQAPWWWGSPKVDHLFRERAEIITQRLSYKKKRMCRGGMRKFNTVLPLNPI